MKVSRGKRSPIRAPNAESGIRNSLLQEASVFKGPYGYEPKSKHMGKPNVQCLCQRSIVLSTWQRIYDGEGESCGRPECHEPKEDT